MSERRKPTSTKFFHRRKVNPAGSQSQESQPPIASPNKESTPAPAPLPEPVLATSSKTSAPTAEEMPEEPFTFIDANTHDSDELKSKLEQQQLVVSTIQSDFRELIKENYKQQMRISQVETELEALKIEVADSAKKFAFRNIPTSITIPYASDDSVPADEDGDSSDGNSIVVVSNEDQSALDDEGNNGVAAPVDDKMAASVVREDEKILISATGHDFNSFCELYKKNRIGEIKLLSCGDETLQIIAENLAKSNSMLPTVAEAAESEPGVSSLINSAEKSGTAPSTSTASACSAATATPEQKAQQAKLNEEYKENVDYLKIKFDGQRRDIDHQLDFELDRLKDAFNQEIEIASRSYADKIKQVFEDLRIAKEAVGRIEKKENVILRTDYDSIFVPGANHPGNAEFYESAGDF